MAEYIDRQELLENLNKFAPEHYSVLVNTLITKQPAADVVEVKHGEWEFRNNGAYGRTRCYCTACGKHSGIGGIRENQLKPYCPNCGAKMDSERKADND